MTPQQISEAIATLEKSIVLDGLTPAITARIEELTDEVEGQELSLGRPESLRLVQLQELIWAQPLDMRFSTTSRSDLI